jgi:hypothetical protein
MENIKYEEDKIEVKEEHTLPQTASLTTGTSFEEESKEIISEVFEKHKIKKIKGYTNFNHKEGYLDTYDFSWDIHGYDIFSKFLPITTKLLTGQFNMAFTMTKRQFAFKEHRVDTSDFRNAIVYYLKEIHGIRDETFKYKKINDLFEIW